ncbi:hypothetical protein F0U60_38935 [Archangium minus]|uniref:Uncharacterized protein n=1 Tax=Archangium minus TaxID=83450 RepID=A0ABY9X206_9BACT|nr:hypothetical protein F0U60_38935 [Archangium minus]
MTADSAELLALRRVMRKNYFVCAALFLVGVSLHWMELGVFVPKLALLNVAWSVSFVVLGLAEGAGWLRCSSPCTARTPGGPRGGEQPAGLREVQPGLPRAGAAARGGAGGSRRAV